MWKERIIEGAIETPDSIRYVFYYRDLEKDIDKKISKYNFGDIDGTLIQDFGLGEVSFPMIIYFSGADCDRTANSFEKSASKKGVCILEHPVYGIKNVVIEKIKRQDLLSTAANQVIFTLTMTETILFEVPVAGEDTRIGILSALEKLKEKISNAYQGSFLATTVTAISNAADRITDAVNEVADSVELISSSVNEITSVVNNTQRYINQNIETLMEAPLTLADSVQEMISAPARAVASVKQRITIYKDLYSDLASNPTGQNTNDKKNQCAEKQLLLPSLVSASCESAVFPDTDGIGFRIRSDATAAAAEVLEFYLDCQDFLDEMQSDTENDNLVNTFVVSDALTQILKYSVALTVKNLVRLSFQLAQERVITLTSDRNLIDLCYELYGTSDDEHLNLLIESNGLTGDDIIMIPSGKEVVYYA